MPPGPFTYREAQELLGVRFNPVGHMDLASGGTLVLHHADHAVGLDVSPSPSGKRLDAVTVCDGNFADTWRAQLSDALEALSSGETSIPHVLFRVQNGREVETRLWNCARDRYSVVSSTRFTHRKRRGGAEGGGGFRNLAFLPDVLPPADLPCRTPTSCAYGRIFLHLPDRPPSPWRRNPARRIERLRVRRRQFVNAPPSRGHSRYTLFPHGRRGWTSTPI